MAGLPVGVLDAGQLVEHATHEQLLARRGRYVALWSQHQRAQRWGLRRDADRAQLSS